MRLIISAFPQTMESIHFQWIRLPLLPSTFLNPIVCVITIRAAGIRPAAHNDESL